MTCVILLASQVLLWSASAAIKENKLWAGLGVRAKSVVRGFAAFLALGILAASLLFILGAIDSSSGLSGRYIDLSRQEISGLHAMSTSRIQISRHLTVSQTMAFSILNLPSFGYATQRQRYGDLTLFM